VHDSTGNEPLRYVLRGGASATRLQRYLHGLPVSTEPWELPPGGGKERNVHQGNPSEEIYLILRGNVEMMVDGVIHQLQPGDAVIAMPQSSHNIRNPGDEPAELLVIWFGPDGPIGWHP
jgi:mannose-6-phosphate isomerase-like protein (cupin superfamily)